VQTLIPAVADPPFDKLGALSLESVYPRKERQALVMALNNLLASPGFETWREGEPLDVAGLLRASDGRPRLSIVYTAHLSDEERLFVTALLLDKVRTWMRRQGGTTQLRALVYMDEIYGYFPPHPANPPTKRPLLTLLGAAAKIRDKLERRRRELAAAEQDLAGRKTEKWAALGTAICPTSASSPAASGRSPAPAPSSPRTAWRTRRSRAWRRCGPRSRSWKAIWAGRTAWTSSGCSSARSCRAGPT